MGNIHILARNQGARLFAGLWYSYTAGAVSESRDGIDMARTTVKFSTEHFNRHLGVRLLFNREIEVTDMKRCRRLFAEALNEVFVASGVALETIDFEAHYNLRPDHDQYPYNVYGQASILRGRVSREQLQEFREVFARLLKATRKYTPIYQQQTVKRIPRTAR